MSTVDYAALLVSLPTSSHLRSPGYLTEAIVEAVTQTQKSLAVIVFSPLFSSDPSRSAESLVNAPVHSWKTVQNLLTFIYVQAAREAQRLDKILLNVDVVLHDSHPSGLGSGVWKSEAERWEAIFALDDGLDDLIPFDDLPISHLPTTIFASSTTISTEDTPELTDSAPKLANDDVAIADDDTTSNLPAIYPVAALGGTFDHLHAGHKILLSLGAWIAKEKLIVGVTDEALLKKKSNASVLEPIGTRMSHVRAFCQLFKPGLEYDVVAIDDIYGPTAWDANIQALVLSYETREGAAAVAKLRNERELPPLEPFVIDVISSSTTRMDPSDAAALRSGKMSSTAIRQWIVDHQNTESKQSGSANEGPNVNK